MSRPKDLPMPRVVKTTHNGDGTSVIASDEHLTPFHPFGPAASSFVQFHSTPRVPAEISTLDDPAQQQDTSGPPRCPPAGVLFCLTDFPPNYSAPMHRTLSLDYACVLSGEIVLRLDGGEERTVKSGEFIVQGGVNHEWINRTDSVVRVLFTMVGSDKITLPSGEALEQTVFGQQNAR